MCCNMDAIGKSGSISQGSTLQPLLRGLTVITQLIMTSVRVKKKSVYIREKAGERAVL